MTDKELVNLLISQHRALQADLKEVAEKLTPLIQFQSDLGAHLTLENGTFYPEYLKRMKAKGQDTAAVIAFIAKMTEIGNAVQAFLKDYDTTEKMTNDKGTFKKRLFEIIKTLNLRIESEEDGVYELFLVI